MGRPPSQPLYHSPRGLYDFQAEAVARIYLRLDNLAVFDTGIGKTHLAMATAALLFEDDEIDRVLVVCEKNKVDEWREDFATFTRLDAALYYGDPKKRAKIRISPPQVLISTYETARNDAAHLVKVEGRRSKRLDPHVLVEALAGQRTLIVYDEITKLGNRGSGLHKAHDLLVQSLRKAGPTRVLGLTATPIERSPENFYNLGRIIAPGLVGTVASFESEHIEAFNIFGDPVKFKNLGRDDTEPGVTPLVDKMRPIVLRKRKTDPDVIDQFPRSVEEFTYVPSTKNHREFYGAVEDIFADAEEQTQRVLYTLKRQIAGHPLSLLGSQGKIAKDIVATVGEEGLRSIGSAKTDRLVEYLEPLTLGQGAQAVVFTFFGPTIIPLLQEALEAKGITCALNHGQMTDGDRKQDKARFKAGDRHVFLTSDAGARGINLPEATYCVEYEMALTHANRLQRLNRIHRIDSTHASVTFQTFIALDTIEEPIALGVLNRNEWSDTLLDDDDPGEDFLSAVDRRRLLARAKSRTV